MNSPNTRSIGELLVDFEVITLQQLDKALEIKKVSDNNIEEILVNEGFVTPKDIVSVLEFILGIPSISIENYGVDPEACKIVPESFARKYDLIPLKKDQQILIVAMSNPLNIFALDDIRIISGMHVQPLISTLDEIREAISKYYGPQKAIKALQEYIENKNINSQSANEEESTDFINNAPTVRLVNSLLEQAIRNKASDIHIEPLETTVNIRFRIDGHLKNIMHIDSKVMQSLLARIKITGGMNLSEKRLPQDGRIRAEVEGKPYDLRVSIIPLIYGEKIVIRILDKSSLVPKEALGLGKMDVEMYDKLLESPYGIILVTGPTGSGKSTTLYNAIQTLNKENVNIVTVEDPVESIIDGVCQIQVNPKIGLTFASGLRSILRQDPDVIMIGEIRDSETAEIAIRSAITGHLVLSTLHTNDAPSSVMRLMDMGIEPFLLASSLVGVIAQRLVRKICPNCKAQYTPNSDEIQLLGLQYNTSTSIYKGLGCQSCLGTGYKGRTGVYEIMILSRTHREMISKKCSEDELRILSISEGMQTIKDSAKKLVLSGVTTVSELKRISYGSE